VGTAVGKASAAPAWRGGGLAGVARQLNSEAAGSAAALSNADLVQIRLKDVLGEKLALRVDLAAVLGDPLMVKSAVTLLHRVRMQCDACVLLLCVAYHDCYLQVDIEPGWQGFVQALLTGGQKPDENAHIPAETVKAVLLLSANLPASASMHDFNEELLSAYGVTGLSQAASLRLRSVWLAFAAERTRLAAAEAHLAAEERAQTEARLAEERAQTEARLALRGILSTETPHTNYVLHLQRQLQEAYDAWESDTGSAGDSECVELFGWLRAMHLAAHGNAMPLGWWKDYFGMTPRPRRAPFYVEEELDSLRACGDDGHSLLFTDALGNEHKVTMSVDSTEYCTSVGKDGKLQRRLMDVDGGAANLSTHGEQRRHPSAVRRVYLTRSGVGDKPAPAALVGEEEPGGFDVKLSKAGQKECVAVLAPVPVVLPHTIGRKKDQTTHYECSSLSVSGAVVTVEDAHFERGAKQQQYEEFAWTWPRAIIAQDAFKALQEQSPGIHIGGVHGAGKSTLQRALHAIITVGGRGDVLFVNDMRDLWLKPPLAIISLLQSSSGDMTELSSGRTLAGLARKMLLQLKSGEHSMGDSVFSRCVSSMLAATDFLTNPADVNATLRASMCDEAAKGYGAFMDHVEHHQWDPKNGFVEGTISGVWQWDGLFQAGHTAAIWASSPDSEHEPRRSLSKVTHPELQLPDPLHAAAIMMASRMKEEVCPDLSFFQAAQVASKLGGNMRYCFDYLERREQHAHRHAMQTSAKELYDTMVERLERRLKNELTAPGNELEASVTAAKREKKAWRGGVAASMVMRESYNAAPGKEHTVDHFVGPLALDSFLHVWEKVFRKNSIPDAGDEFEKYCIQRLGDVDQSTQPPLLQSLRRRLGVANAGAYQAESNMAAVRALNTPLVTRTTVLEAEEGLGVENASPYLSAKSLKWLGGAQVGERRVLVPQIRNFPAADCIVHQVPEQDQHEVYVFQFTVSTHQAHDTVIGRDLKLLLLEPTAAYVSACGSDADPDGVGHPAYWMLQTKDGKLSRMNALLAGMGAPVELKPRGATEFARDAKHARELLKSMRQVDRRQKGKGATQGPKHESGLLENGAHAWRKPRKGEKWAVRVVYVSRQPSVVHRDTPDYDTFAPGIAFWATQEDLNASTTGKAGRGGHTSKAGD